MKKKLIFVFCLAFVITAGVFGQNRFALVIGNNNYHSNSLPNLQNAINDAQDISAALTRLGYQVELKIDLNNYGMIEAIDNFVTRLSRNRMNEGFFWFAGHGAQIDNENYLMAVNVRIDTNDHIRSGSFPLNRLINRLSSANNRINVVVLDACREIPSQPGPGGLTRSIGTTRGLSVIPVVPPDIFIMFSTAAGDVAADGVPGSRNSPFATAFLNHINSTEPFLLTAAYIRNETLALTGNRQRPFTSGSFGDIRWTLNMSGIPAAPRLTPPLAAIATIPPTLDRNFDQVLGREWKLYEVWIGGRNIGFNRNTLATEGFRDAFTLEFDAERISGAAAPNRYFVPYTLGQGNAISVGIVASTMMVPIIEPEQLREHDYLFFIENMYRWNLTGDRLELSSRGRVGEEVKLIFQLNSAQPQASAHRGDELPHIVRNARRNAPEDVLVGIGMARLTTQSQSRAMAESRARGEIARVMDTMVQQMIRDYTARSAIAYSTVLAFQEDISVQLSRARLQGAVIVDTAFINGNYYVVMHLSKANVVNEINQAQAAARLRVPQMASFNAGQRINEAFARAVVEELQTTFP